MSINIILRAYLPSNIYLCYETDYKDWNYIHEFIFNNGLTYYAGATDIILDIHLIKKNLKSEYNIYKKCKTPEELYHYYYTNFNLFIKINDCEKIYNYFHDNKDLIDHVLLEK